MNRDPSDANPPRPARTAKATVSDIVLICTKCAKRQGLSKRALRDRLKTAAKAARPRVRLRIVETGCLGPCPKRLIAVATGASVAAGRIPLIDPAASGTEILAALLPRGPTPRPLPRPSGIGDGRDAARVVAPAAASQVETMPLDSRPLPPRNGDTDR